MNIRKFNNNDLEKCLVLFIDVFGSEPWNDKWTKERARSYLSDFIATPGFIGIVAESNNSEMIGMILGSRRQWWSGDEYFINEMCVAHHSQNTGVGSAMFKLLEETLSSKGIKDIALLTDRGVPAEEFYRKNGFNEVERIMFLAKSMDE